MSHISMPQAIMHPQAQLGPLTSSPRACTFPSPTRPLPAKRNKMMDAANTPSYEDLVKSRHRGLTSNPPKDTPSYKAAQFYINTPVALPHDIFSDFTSSPSCTYLLSRVSDNFISATCIFRAVFPYAGADEKIREIGHLKGVWKSEYDKKTGNVWIPAVQGRKWREEYGIRRWVDSLCDEGKVRKTGVAVVDLTGDSEEED